MKRTLAGLAILAGFTAVAAGAAPPSPGETLQFRAEGQGQDAASVSLFVRQLRAESERAGLPPRSLQEAISRVVPDVEGFPRCLTPVVLELGRQSAQAPALAMYAGPVLAPPVLPRESVLTTAEGDFAVHYTSDRASGHGVFARDRDGNGSPDYVDQVAAALSDAKAKIVGRLGYRDPRTDAPIDVYLANLGGRLDGYTLSRSGQRPLALVVDSRLLGNDALLRAAVAHQYAHAVLEDYDVDAPAWWTEASASWLEGLVVGSYAHYTEQLQAALEDAAAGLGFDDARSMQGRLLWPAFLSSSGAKGALVREIWENLEHAGDGADIWGATEQALRPTGLSLGDAFSEYALWMLLSGERNDGRHFDFADRLSGVLYSGDYTAYPAAEIQSTPMLAPFGSAFLRFEAPGEAGGVRLSFEGASPGQFQAQLLLTPRKRGASLVRAVIGVDGRGHGSIGIPWATFSEAVLIVGNIAKDPEPAAYSFFARTDPTFPFEVTAFAAEPEDGEIRVTWETRSEDDLFGWIVYRSERTGETPRRVNDLIVPAIGDGDGPVSYQYLDDAVRAGRTYYYSLVGVTREGLTREVPKTRVDLPR